MNFLSLSLILSSLAVASGQTSLKDSILSIVQTYFIPLPEEELFASFQKISTTSAGPITTLISVAIAVDKTIIYWDHWEDGYEPDPANPVQPSTEIWGTGSGTRPTLLSGNTIVLENTVPVSGNRSGIIRYDGRDRISATLPIAVTRSAYPEKPGPLLAGAVEVFPVQSWGQEYLSPIASELFGTNPFEYAAFSVMAGFDQTEVTFNGNTTLLQTGESLLLGPLARGQSLTSNRPIQVDIIGGDAASNYELRWYALVPSDEFTTEYFSPVAETRGTTGFWFYNPGTTSITVNYEGGNISSPGSITVLAGGGKFIECAETGANVIQVGKESSTTFNGKTAYYTGLRFYSTNKFYVLAQIDADTASESGATPGTLFDWGFPLIPSDQLTSQVVVGLGKGCRTATCSDPNFRVQTDERSVVWVTPEEDTKIFVDYEGDGTFDDVFDLGALDALRLVDTKNNDNDMTGAIIASFKTEGANKTPTGVPVKIAAAWGIDPVRSGSNDGQGLDLGTVILPLPNPFLSKRVENVTNPDGSLDPQLLVDEVGDIIYYEITVTNAGFSDLAAANIKLFDELITNAGGVLIGPVESFPNTPGVLSRGEKFAYFGSYVVTAADISKKINNGVDMIPNTAKLVVKSLPNRTSTVVTPIILATIAGTVFEDIDDDDVGDVVLPGVLITLSRNNAILANTFTDSNGAYKFTDLTAGTYFVNQVNLDPSYTDVKDKDGGDKNMITVSVVGGDNSIGNDFVDERRGSISGNVEDESGNPIPSVLLTLKTPNGTVVATTATDSFGNYIFSDLGPSNYTVEETNAPSFTIDVSDYDTDPDGDVFDVDTTVDNLIKVNLKPAEKDGGNDFVDSNPPSSAPSASPSRLPSAIPSADPTSKPSAKPSSDPSSTPSSKPTVVASEVPSASPSAKPSKVASSVPSTSPSADPSSRPSALPSAKPSRDPSSTPSSKPSVVRSEIPSASPSEKPSKVASSVPSSSPSADPSSKPSASPSSKPSRDPSSTPSRKPSVVRSEIPSPSPSEEPSKVASSVPSSSPSAKPSRKPSVVRSEIPSPSPSEEPSKVASSVPSSSPSAKPSRKPSVVRSEIPSPSPSEEPSKVASSVPSSSPSAKPSRKPSVVRSEIPSPSPSETPSKVASSVPSYSPSEKPQPKDSRAPTPICPACEIDPKSNCTTCLPSRSPGTSCPFLGAPSVLLSQLCSHRLL